MWYILDEDNKPLPAKTSEYSKWVDVNFFRKSIGKTEIGRSRISTIFLGLDHGWGEGLPVLWETMVFGPENDLNSGYQERYTSYDEAIKGHEKVVRAMVLNEEILDK